MLEVYQNCSDLIIISLNILFNLSIKCVRKLKKNTLKPNNLLKFKMFIKIYIPIPC